MKIISWNVNGIRAVAKKGLHEFVAQQSPDILCIQETKIQHDQLLNEDIFNPDLLEQSYTYFKSAALKKGYSGVLTLVKDSLLTPAITSSVAHGIDQEVYDSEGRFVISDHGDFLLYNIYIPSGTSGELRQDFKYSFLDSFYSHIKGLPKKDLERVIICGDFNICHKEIDIHHPKVASQRGLSGFLPKEREWFDSFLELGLYDAYRENRGDESGKYTWWSYRAGSRGKNLGWRIDYFIVGKKIRDAIRNTIIHSEVMGSDHCPIVLEL
jgi:exodeoxyribonuclease-3